MSLGGKQVLHACYVNYQFKSFFKSRYKVFPEKILQFALTLNLHILDIREIVFCLIKLS